MPYNDADNIATRMYQDWLSIKVERYEDHRRKGLKEKPKNTPISPSTMTNYTRSFNKFIAFRSDKLEDLIPAVTQKLSRLSAGWSKGLRILDIERKEDWKKYKQGD